MSSLIKTKEAKKETKNVNFMHFKLSANTLTLLDFAGANRERGKKQHNMMSNSQAFAIHFLLSSSDMLQKLN